MGAELTPKQWEHRLARCLVGPRNPLPAGMPYTLEHLREINWLRCSSQERSGHLWDARTILAEIERQGYALVKRDDT